MENEIKIYRVKKSNLSPGIFVLTLVLLGLTLPALTSGEPLSRGQLIGQIIFLSLGVFLTLVPLVAKFEIGKDYVKVYFFGVCIDTLQASDIESVKYGKVVRWGAVGMGNGLTGWVSTKRGRRYFSFSESGYGKDAILHAKRVLEG